MKQNIYPAPPGYRYNPGTNTYEAIPEQPPIMNYQRGMAYGQPMYNPNPYPYQEPYGLPGKHITNMQDIKVTDVPNDGKGYYPTADGNYVVSKEWTNNGTIDTKVYQLVNNQQQQQNGPSFEELVMQRFERIEQMLQPQQKAPSKPQKKEGQSNEQIQ